MAVTVAIVGPKGLVGNEILEVLADRQFPFGAIRLLGSLRTAGSEVEYAGCRGRVELLGRGVFEGVDVAFFAAGPGVSGEYAPAAAAAGAASAACRGRPSICCVRKGCGARKEAPGRLPSTVCLRSEASSPAVPPCMSCRWWRRRARCSAIRASR